MALVLTNWNYDSSYHIIDNKTVCKNVLIRDESTLNIAGILSKFKKGYVRILHGVSYKYTRFKNTIQDYKSAKPKLDIVILACKSNNKALIEFCYKYRTKQDFPIYLMIECEDRQTPLEEDRQTRIIPIGDRAAEFAGYFIKKILFGDSWSRVYDHVELREVCIYNPKSHHQIMDPHCNFLKGGKDLIIYTTAFTRIVPNDAPILLVFNSKIEPIAKVRFGTAAHSVYEIFFDADKKQYNLYRIGRKTRTFIEQFSGREVDIDQLICQILDKIEYFNFDARLVADSQ